MAELPMKITEQIINVVNAAKKYADDPKLSKVKLTRLQAALKEVFGDD